MKRFIDHILSRQVEYVAKSAYSIDSKEDVYDRVYQAWVIIWAFINFNVWLLLGEPEMNSYLLVFVCVGIPLIVLSPLKKYLKKFDPKMSAISKKNKLKYAIQGIAIWTIFILTWSFLMFFS